MTVCLIPARLGSQRLYQKNLLHINGQSLVRLCCLKALGSGVFDKVVVSSDSDLILNETVDLDVERVKRAATLADSVATSEDFVFDYLVKNPNVKNLVMLHSIAPLLTVDSVIGFTNNFLSMRGIDTQLSTDETVLEYIYKSKPVNFDFSTKTNSQDLPKLERINWAISAWRRISFIKGYISENQCGTYSGKIDYYKVPRNEALMIKEKGDYLVAKFLIENGRTE
jgi:CMP-N-acetylneuraminic acid synthetase